MTQRIFLFETEGRPALGFDTGLDARAFAQAKAARFITEPGLIVYPDGKIEEWKAAGVLEQETMVVWGPAFEGDHFDLLITDDRRRNRALSAVCAWIRARLFLGGRQTSLLPCAAIVADKGDRHPPDTVFFSPENLVLRCIQAEAADERMRGGEWYIHPGYTGAEAEAFTAAAMLYRIFAGTAPFGSLDETTLHQDMREGNFTPFRLAAPGIDVRLAAMVENVLRPGKNAGDTGEAILRSFIALLSMADGSAEKVTPPSAESFFTPLSEADTTSLAKEKEQVLQRKKIAVKTKRFVMRNTVIILGCLAGLVSAALIAYSVAQSRAALPTTMGLASGEVVERYYMAIGELDHQMMEACVLDKAGKNDINMVANFYVISKVRQAYEPNAAPLIVPAQQWKESGGGPVEGQVFGVSDLKIEALYGNEDSNEVRWRADYTLWIPDQGEGEAKARGITGEASPAHQAYHYTDELTLIRRHGNWRIFKLERKDSTNSPQASG
jgi:hypothetical protein